MIIVRVELHSAITGQVTEIARAAICNVGGTAERGDYKCETYRGRDTAALNERRCQRVGNVKDHARQRLHVWYLVARALAAMGYSEASALRQQSLAFDGNPEAAHDST